MKVGNLKDLAGYLKTIRQPSQDILAVNRETMCGKAGEFDCEMSYEVRWAKESAKDGLKFNIPNTGNVDEYITYDITIEYKGKSVTHSGVILHYKTKNAGFLIYDGIIPQIDALVLDRMPLMIENPRRVRAFSGTQSKAKVKELKSARVWSATQEDDEIIGWLPGDEIDYDDFGEMSIMMSAALAADCVCADQPDGTTCPTVGPGCFISRCQYGECVHTEITALSTYNGPEENNPVNTANLQPGTETARNCLINAVKAAGGSEFNTTSAYRSQPYQDHFVELWDIWKVKDLENWVSIECSSIKQSIEDEFNIHGLVYPPAKISNHTDGRSFDGNAIGLPTNVNIETLANQCNLSVLNEGSVYHFTWSCTTQCNNENSQCQQNIPALVEMCPSNCVEQLLSEYPMCGSYPSMCMGMLNECILDCEYNAQSTCTNQYNYCMTGCK